MDLNENLTHLQKVALQGEVALVLNSAPHDAELKYRSFILLQEVDEKLREFVLQGIKDFTEIPETEIDRIYLEVKTNQVPVWLWVEKCVADLRTALKSEDMALVIGRAKIDKKNCKKSIIESAFIQFMRNAMSLSVQASRKVCLEILDCYDLEFLHASCFYLLSVCDSISEFKSIKETKIPMKLLDCTFNIRNILSFKMETKALDFLNRSEKEPIWNDRAQHEGEFTHVIELDSKKAKQLTTEQLSNFLSQKITELFEETTSKEESFKNTPPISKPEQAPHRFVVKKVFKGMDEGIVLRDFENKKEAEEFKESIERKFPDLLKTCEFIITEER